MKIAVTSQNKKTITGHTGKCRRFWIFDVGDDVPEDLYQAVAEVLAFVYKLKNK